MTWENDARRKLLWPQETWSSNPWSARGGFERSFRLSGVSLSTLEDAAHLCSMDTSGHRRTATVDCGRRRSLRMLFIQCPSGPRGARRRQGYGLLLRHHRSPSGALGDRLGSLCSAQVGGPSVIPASYSQLNGEYACPGLRVSTGSSMPTQIALRMST